MSQKKRTNGWLVFHFCVTVIAACTAMPHNGIAQLPGIPGIPGLQASPDELNPETRPELRLAIDRKTIQKLESFRERLKAGDIDRAIDDFNTLKTADPLTLVPSEFSRVYIPLFRAVFDASFKIPDAERQKLAETESGRSAAALASAMDDSMANAIPELILKGSGTPAAVTAHLIAAKLHLSRGNHFAAKSWLSPMLGDDVPADIRTAALAIQQQIPADDTASSLPQKSTSSELPKHLAWQSRPAASPRLRKQLTTFRAAAHKANIIPQISWKSDIDDDAIFRRTFRGLAAIDPASGFTKWEYPIGRSLDTTILSNRANASIFGRNLPVGQVSSGFQSLEQSAVANTFCRDNSVGRIASDADHLYLATSTRRTSSSSSQMRNALLLASGVSSNASSGLVAIEKQTGRRVWTLGRAALEDQLGSSESGDWFAGPPRPSGKRLYSVFEWNGEMRLGCVASKTGELLWTTSLAYPEQSISKDLVRQYWGATPFRHAGLIWCPTTTGWLTCVDELTHSVAYATQIETRPPNQPRITFGRNQAVALTPSASLSNRWSVPHLIPVDDRMAVIANESRAIHLIESISGRQIKTIEVNPGEILLHSDSERIVLASPISIRSVATANGLKNWQQPLTPETGYPCGSAAIAGSDLLVPLNTGAIARCDLQTGEFTETANDVIPVNNWGRLVTSAELNGDLLFLSPDRISRLSVRPTDSTPGNPLEIAASRVANEEWTEALEIATSIPRISEGYKEAQSIIFESRLRLASKNPELHLEALKVAELTPEELLQVRIFDAALNYKQGQFKNACNKLIEVLKSDQMILRANVPAIASMWEQSTAEPDIASQDTMKVRQTVRTWASTKLNDVMDGLPDSLLNQIPVDELPDAALLVISHPIALPVLHERMSSTESTEFWWHAMAHCMKIKEKQSDATAEEELALASAKVDAIITADEMPQASRTLLAVSLAGLSAEFAKLAEPLAPDLTNHAEDHRQQIVDKFQQWDADSYKAIPVNRVSSYGSATARVQNSVLDDIILGSYNWQATRNTWGRLQAKGIADATDQWSIPGQFTVNGMYSTSSDTLQRYGSIVVLNTTQKTTAISLLDQRIVWDRTNSYAISRFTTRNANFEKFDPKRNRLPSRSAYSGSHVCGYGNRWMCIQSGRQIEVIDSLTGQTQWSFNFANSTDRVIATDDVVIISTINNQKTTCFDRRSGQPVDLPDAPTLANYAIRNVGPLAVVWQPATDDTPNILKWIDPLTSKTSKKVSLDGLRAFHFLDDETLVGFNDSSEFMTIDLIDGHTQKMSFADSKYTAKANPVTDENPQSSSLDAPLWDLSRIQLFADHLNFYVCNRPDRNKRAMQPPTGMSVVQFQGDLRAIDRRSGKPGWVMKNEGVLLATVDHPELATLVLMENAGRPAAQPVPGQALTSQNVFRGVSKLSGEDLFRLKLPSRLGLRFVQLDSPKANVLDIAVYGSQVRIQGTP